MGEVPLYRGTRTLNGPDVKWNEMKSNEMKPHQTRQVNVLGGRLNAGIDSFSQVSSSSLLLSGLELSDTNVYVP